MSQWERSLEDQRTLERMHHELQHQRAEQMQTVLNASVRLSGSLTVQVAETNERISRLENSTTERFDKVDQRFDQVDQRIDRSENSTNERFDKVDQRFDQVDRRFDKVEQRFDKLDVRIDEMGKEVRHSAGRIEYLIGLVVRDELKAPPADPALTTVK